MEIRQSGNAVSFAVHVQPRAATTEVVGEHGDAVKIRVAAPPVEGAANDALIRFLARLLAVAPSSVRVLRGSSGRRKLIEVDGITEARVRAALFGAR